MTVQPMQQARDTAANWTSVNPVPLSGQWCKETDTGKWKAGDGVTAWTSLPYVAGPTGVSAGTYTNASITVDANGRVSAAATGTAGVTTFNTRAGAVVPQSSDYAAFYDASGAASAAQAAAEAAAEAASLPRPAGTAAAGMFPVATGASASAWVAFPAVIVSPVGLAGGAAVANNGWPFGVDTPGTVTCGIQEALNSLPACSVYDAYHNLVAGQKGHVHLLPGIYETSGPVTIPPGTIRFTGGGTSAWSEVFTISAPTQDLGGSVIVAADSSASAVTCPLDAYGYPGSALWMDGIEVRMISPATQQTTSAPSVLWLPGMAFGEVSNVAVLEVAAAGGIGHNMYVILDMGGGSPTNGNDIHLVNIRGYGGNCGVRIDRAHCHARNVSGGSTGNGLPNATALWIRQELEDSFENLHAFSSLTGITWHAYTPDTGGQTIPQTIRTVHFEAVTHYLALESASESGTLFIDGPIWDETSPLPAADIAAQVAAQSSTPNLGTLTGLAVVTSRELNDKNDAGWHVTPAPASLTAGASPYSFPLWPYDVLLVLSATGGMTALTLDGQALFGGTFTAGQIVPVRAGHALVATWATTAPVFQCLPQ